MDRLQPHLYLGCPVWACPHWGGEVYPKGAPRHQWLRWYSQCFNTVEGNSTFYSLPNEETAKGWAKGVDAGFRFSFKFPRRISHEAMLYNCEKETESFLRFLSHFAEQGCLGSTFLQLPPHFSGQHFAVLEKYLMSLPKDCLWSVEVRHMDWFDRATVEDRLDALLTSLGIDRVLFDSQPLYSRPAEDEAERASQGRKPRSPDRTTVTGSQPMVRFVGRNRLEQTEPFLDRWVDQVAQWIEQGKRPYFFTHTPDDRFAPELARCFYQRLALRTSLVAPDAFTLPKAVAGEGKPPKQLNLF